MARIRYIENSQIVAIVDVQVTMAVEVGHVSPCVEWRADTGIETKDRDVLGITMLVPFGELAGKLTAVVNLRSRLWPYKFSGGRIHAVVLPWNEIPGFEVGRQVEPLGQVGILDVDAGRSEL